MFDMSQKNDDAGLRSSYNRSGKPRTIGEKIILTAIEEVISTVINHKSPNQIIKSIPLSYNSVQRRIDEMAEDVRETLCNILKIQPFALQLYESTMPGNEALLLGYVCFEYGIFEESCTQRFYNTLCYSQTASSCKKSK